MSETSTARRVRKTPEQRRAELAAAARAVALEQGLDAVTLRAVAARAGVAPGLVAHYGDGMEELVAATFGDLVRAELDEVAALVRQRHDPAARIGLLLDTLLDGTRRDITLVWVQAWGIGARSDVLAARVRVEMDAWQEMIAAEIVRGMDAGVFTPGAAADPAAIAWHLLAMIDGLNAHSLVRWDAQPGRRTLTIRSVAGLLGIPPERLAPRS